MAVINYFLIHIISGTFQFAMLTIELTNELTLPFLKLLYVTNEIIYC